MSLLSVEFNSGVPVKKLDFHIKGISLIDLGFDVLSYDYKPESATLILCISNKEDMDV